MQTDRRPITWLSIVLIVLAALTLAAIPVAAAELPFHDTPSLRVSGTQPREMGELMPGGQLPGMTITVVVTGSLAYQLHVKTTGSEALARLLAVTIVAQPSGAIVYRGPLAEAAIGGAGSASPGRTLNNETETLEVTGSLPLTAGNEVQGARLTVEWTVQATEPAAA